MPSAHRHAEGGARHPLLMLARGFVCARLQLAAVVIAAGAAVGCAPYAHEADDAMFDAATSPRTRSKARVPLPSRSLLTRQAEPKCEEAEAAGGSRSIGQPQPAKGEAKRVASTEAADGATGAAHSEGRSPAAAAASPPPDPADANASLALRIKLEYERECYRQAEMRTRNRLHELQDSVGATVKAVNRMDQ